MFNRLDTLCIQNILQLIKCQQRSRRNVIDRTFFQYGLIVGFGFGQSGCCNSFIGFQTLDLFFNFQKSACVLSFLFVQLTLFLKIFIIVVYAASLHLFANTLGMLQ